MVYMADTIKRFSKNKGYESLPRELLQNLDLSLEAIGLIANISSYPDTWVLRKTELQNRFPKHGRRVIDRIWDELVELNFIVQFRKRVGRSYDYRYFYNVTPFTLDEIQELLLHNFDDNFVLYHKQMKDVDFKVLELRDYLFVENKQNLDCSFWDVQNAQSTESDNSNIPSNVHFEQFKLDSSKRTLSKLIKEEINYKEINNNKLSINSVSENELMIFEELLQDKTSVGHAMKFLYSTGLEIKIILDITMQLHLQPQLAIPELIVQQTELTNRLVKEGKIYSYANYFIKGLEMRFSGYETRVGADEIDSYYENVTGDNWDLLGESLANLVQNELKSR